MPYYARDIERTLVQAASAFRVVALTGARQTGKSTLLRKLFGKTHPYISLDPPRFRKLAQEDPELFLEQNAGKPLLIDEIQYAPNLLPYIKVRVDRSTRKGQ